jgi:hypothetical protein
MVANTKLSGQFGKIGRPAFRPPSETRTPYIAPLRTKANGALCYSYAWLCIAQFNNTKFTSLGGLPEIFG